MVFWAGPVWKLHLVDSDAMPAEAACIVQLVIQADYSFDVHVQKLVYQVVRAHIVAHSSAASIGCFLWRGEGNDLIWHDPREVPMLEHALKLEAVEAAHGEPFELASSADSIEAVYHGQWKVIWAHSSITEWTQSLQVRASKCIFDL